MKNKTITGTRQAASAVPAFKNKGKKLVTKNGCYVNFHGLFFFSDPAIKARRPWRLTITKGILPNSQEWKRLQTEHGLRPVELTEAEEIAAQKIAGQMKKHPRQWMEQREFRSFMRRKDERMRIEGPATAYAYQESTRATLGSLIKKAL